MLADAPGDGKRTPRAAAFATRARMIRAGSGLSLRADARAAAAEATAAALAGAGTADAALLFAGPGHGAALPELLDAAVGALGTAAVAGASAYGVLGAGRAIEADSAVAVLAWSGVESHPFLLPDPRGDEVAACEEIAARLGSAPRPEDLVVLLPDPRSFDAGAFLPALRGALGPAQVVGAAAGDPLGGAPRQWCGRSVASGAVAGVVLRPSRAPRIGVTQGCRPVTPPLTVTRARGHWLLELDGRPALEVYREALRGPLAADLPRAAAFVLVALPADPRAAALAPGSYRVRHVVGFEPEENAFAIPELVKPGMRLALAVREPEQAREDLKAMLAETLDGPAALGLYLDCCARAGGFFTPPELEAAYLERALGSAPYAGMYGSCEIGPIGGRSELLTYTGVLAVLDASG
jgi:small ligand-binding sensory domain FIST